MKPDAPPETGTGRWASREVPLMGAPPRIDNCFLGPGRSLSLISHLAGSPHRSYSLVSAGNVKTHRLLVLGLVFLHWTRAPVPGDEVDDTVAGLGTVAIDGNYDYPLRIIAHNLAQHPNDPRLTRFKALLLLSRQREMGAAANGPVAAETSMSEVPDFPCATPIEGRPFTTVTARIGMVWIPAGTLLMSSIRGSDDDTLVTLSHGYWLGRTEVTQAQWAAVMDNLPRPSRYRGANRPVEQVSWVSAMAFCLKVTDSERSAGRLPAGYVYALPTEAQWEFACRAGGPGSATVSPDLAWCSINSDQQSHSVGQKNPNAWGLYDMHGNVWEWCIDGYQGYPGGAVTDLQGGYAAPSAATFRIVRGGGFMSNLGECRADNRQWNPLNASNATTGLRLALVPQHPIVKERIAPGDPTESPRDPSP